MFELFQFFTLVLIAVSMLFIDLDNGVHRALAGVGSLLLGGVLAGAVGLVRWWRSERVWRVMRQKHQEVA